MSDDPGSHPFGPRESAPGSYGASRSRYGAPPEALPPLRDPYDSGPSSPRREAGQLDDPYWPQVGEAPGSRPASGKRPLSQLAVTSVLTLLLGPIGSLASIAFGVAARREIARAGGEKRGKGAANVGIALGCALTLAWAGVVGLIVVQQGRAIAQRAETSESDDDADPAAHGAPDQQPTMPGPIPPGPIPGVPFAPKVTKTAKVGGIEVVDIGASVSSLSDELARQRAAGQQAGEKILVMTTAGKCDPCRGVDKALQDALLQGALEKTRLVRVDIDVFHDDLQALKMPVKAIPGFFLLSPDLTPKDAINGGEWDDDIPQNIAPVLGAFMRGKYAKRREGWKAAPGSGIRL